MVHVGSLCGLQEIAALHDRRAAIARVSCAPQHAVCVDIFACIGLDAMQVQLQTDKILETAARLAVHPVTEGSSNDDVVGVSFDRVYGRVSVKNRRIWMVKLAMEDALRRNALSGASLRRLVRHLSYAFFVTASCLSILSSAHAFIDACPRWIAKLWSNVWRELRWAASLLPFVFADLRRPWYGRLSLATPPCLAMGFVSADAQNMKLRKSAVTLKKQSRLIRTYHTMQDL